MNYYSHNIGDYAQATMHLSLVEDAIYSRLLRRYYAEEQPIINDLAMVCRWVGARSAEEKEAVEVILNEFFVLDGNVWRNKRADEEIAAYREKAAKASSSAAKRWGKSDQTDAKPSNSEGNANAMRPHSEGNANQEPITKNQEPVKEKEGTPAAQPSVSKAKKPAKFNAADIELPDWLPADAWKRWAKDRADRKKPITEEGARQQIGKLADYLADGYSPESVIDHCIAGGYQGLFPPSKPQTRAAASPRDVENQRRSAEFLRLVGDEDDSNTIEMEPARAIR